MGGDREMRSPYIEDDGVDDALHEDEALPCVGGSIDEQGWIVCHVSTSAHNLGIHTTPNMQRIHINQTAPLPYLELGVLGQEVLPDLGRRLVPVRRRLPRAPRRLAMRLVLDVNGEDWSGVVGKGGGA